MSKKANVSIGPKLFWTDTSCIGWVQIVLAWVQIIFVRFKLDFSWLICIPNLDLSKMIWAQPEQIGSVQNDWYSTKNIWTVQNHLGPIKCPEMSRKVQKCPEMSKNVQKKSKIVIT